MYLINRLIGFVPLLVICCLIVLLEQRFSLVVGASIYAGLVLLATLAGAMLLRSSAVGQSSWRKRVADMQAGRSVPIDQARMTDRAMLVERFAQ